MFKYGSELGIKVVPVFGGQPIQRQLQALDRGAHVVVATPGRALDHIGRGSLGLERDHARSSSTRPTRCSTWASPTTSSRFCESTPEDRQTVLFSATMPGADHVDRQALPARSPAHHDQAQRCRQRFEGELIRQTVYVVQRAHKPSRARTHPRHRGTEGRTRLLSHAHRGRPAHRDDERARLPRRGAARRHGPGPARPRRWLACATAPPNCSWPPTSPPAASTSTRSPTSSTTTCRRRRRATSTASVASGAPDAKASPSRSPSRASDAACENIERLTKQKFEIATVPTVADLRAKQIEMTVNAVREALDVATTSRTSTPCSTRCRARTATATSPSPRSSWCTSHAARRSTSSRSPTRPTACAAASMTRAARSSTRAARAARGRRQGPQRRRA